MKKLKFAIVLLAFVGLTLVGCSEQSQSPVAPNDQFSNQQEQGSLEKCIVTNFKATYHVTGLIDPGSNKVVRGKLITKGQVIECTYDYSDNALVGGTLTLYANSILDVNTGEGPVHGKYTITPISADAEGGVWEGIWWGSRKKTGESEWTTSLMTTGQGKGGSLKRMQLYSRETIHFTDLFGEAGFNGESKGYIKSH
jgi:hypothetical protein